MRQKINKKAVVASLVVGLFFVAQILAKKVEAVVYDAGGDNTFCTSDVQTTLNDGTSGFLSYFSPTFQGYLQTDVCAGKISLPTAAQWETIKTVYQAALNEGTSGTSYLPQGSAAWTQSAAGSGNVYTVAAADGSSTTATAVTDTTPAAIPTVTINANMCAVEGSGTSANPYVAAVCDLSKNQTYFDASSNVFCGSAVQNRLNATASGFLSLFDTYDQSYLSAVDCSAKISLPTTSQWEATGVKTAYQTALNGSASGAYLPGELTRAWTQSAASTGNVYTLDSSAGTSTTETAVTDFYTQTLPTIYFESALTTDTDAAAGTAADPYEVIAPAAAPTITIINEAATVIATISKGLSIYGTVSDPNDETLTISMSISGVVKSTTVTAPVRGGGWTLHWDWNELTAGDYTNATASVSDGSNTVTAIKSGTIVVDQTAPFCTAASEVVTDGAMPRRLFNATGRVANYRIEGESAQATTPTPSAPAEVISLGREITDSSDENYGKYAIDIVNSDGVNDNLLNILTFVRGRLDNGVLDYANDTTKLEVSGDTITFAVTARYRGITSDFIAVLPETVYNLEYDAVSAVLTYSYEWFDADKNWLVRATDLTQPSPANAAFVRVRIVTSDASQNNTDITIENLGVYEDNSGADEIKKQTTTVYLDEPLRCIGVGSIDEVCDYLDFANQRVVRNVYEKVLTGEESIVYGSGLQFYIRKDNFSPAVVPETQAFSTHFAYSTGFTSNGTVGDGYDGTFKVGANWALVWRKDDITSAAAMQTWLAGQVTAGTPVKVYFELATPTETPMVLPELNLMNGETTAITVNDGTVNSSRMVLNYYAASNLTGSVWSPSEPVPWKTAAATQDFILQSAYDLGGSGLTAATYSCTAAAENGATCSAQLADLAGNTSTCVSPANRIDEAAPTGGSVSFTSQTVTAADTAVSLTVSDGTDTISGVNTTTRNLQQRVAALDGEGECSGTYGEWSAVTFAGAYPDITTAGFESDGCFQYAWAVEDNAGNSAFFANTEAVIKVTGVSAAGRVYDAGGDNTWCGSDLQTWLNDGNDGYLSYFTDLHRGYIANSQCSAPLSLVTATEWTDNRTLYQTALHGSASGAYLPTASSSAWTSSAASTGKADVVLGTGGILSEFSVTSTVPTAELVTIYFNDMDLCSRDDILSYGNITNPYIIEACNWSANPTYFDLEANTYCGSAVQERLVAEEGSFYALFAEGEKQMMAAGVCSSPVNLLTAAEWNASGAKTTYQTTIDNNSSYLPGTQTRAWLQDAASSGNVYTISASAGTTSTETAIKDLQTAAVPAVYLQAGALGISGTGTVADPYILHQELSAPTLTLNEATMTSVMATTATGLTLSGTITDSNHGEILAVDATISGVYKRTTLSSPQTAGTWSLHWAWSELPVTVTESGVTVVADDGFLQTTLTDDLQIIIDKTEPFCYPVAETTVSGTAPLILNASSGRIKNYRVEGESVQQATPSSASPSAVISLGRTNFLNPQIDNSTRNGVTISYDETTQAITLDGTCTTDNTTFSFSDSSLAKAMVVNGDFTIRLLYLGGALTPQGSVQFQMGNEDWSQFFTIGLGENDALKTQTIAGDPNWKTINIRADAGTVFDNYQFKLGITRDVGAEVNFVDFGDYEIYGFAQPASNLFDLRNAVMSANYFLNDNGSKQGNVNLGYTKMHIVVEPNTTYVVRGLGQSVAHKAGVYYFDANKEFISRNVDYLSGDFVFTTPANCNFVDFQYYAATSENIVAVNWEDVVLQLGSSVDVNDEGTGKQTWILSEPLRCVGEGEIRVCDYLDYLNQRVVRNVGVIKLNGLGNWEVRTNHGEGVYRYQSSFSSVRWNEYSDASLAVASSNYFRPVEYNANYEQVNYEAVTVQPASRYIVFFTTKATVAEWQAWLAEKFADGRPVTVYYRLKESKIEPLTLTAGQTAEGNMEFAATDGFLTSSYMVANYYRRSAEAVWEPAAPVPWKLTPATQDFTLENADDAGGSGVAEGTFGCTAAAENGATCSAQVSDKAGNTTMCLSPTNRIDNLLQAGTIVYDDKEVDDLKATTAITTTDGSWVSGVNTTTRRLERRQGVLTDNGCQDYGAWTETTYTGAYPSYVANEVLRGGMYTCYQYRYVVESNAGNVGYFTAAATVRVEALPTKSLSTLPVGAVVQLGQYKFVKVNVGGLYLMLSGWR